MEGVVGLRAVGICGHIGAGKDTVADMLIDAGGRHFLKYSIADPIRRMARDIFGFTDLQLSDHELKEAVDPFWGMTPRRFMQLVGTELFRERLDRLVWVKLAARQMVAKKDWHLVIPDIRTLDEVQLVKDSGGLMIKISRPGYEVPILAQDHVTERGIPDELVDIFMSNVGGTDQLRRTVEMSVLPGIRDRFGELKGSCPMTPGGE